MNAKQTTKTARRAPSIRARLISAGAMLLVSAIMLVSTSYAWYVLSTAPEVSNIKTQVGANGALEIALLDANSWGNLTLLDMGDIDESAEGETASTAANLTWGNLVNLGDASYGMDQIVLNPARLYIQKNGTATDGTTTYSVNDVLLKTPLYREDGRVEKLETTAVAYTYGGSAFDVKDGYGVRAIGTSSTMGVFQLGMNKARAGIQSAISAARTKASNALNENGSALANIIVQYAIDGKTTGYTSADIAAIKAMAEGLQTALDEIETALRQAFAGYITTVDSGITSENYQAALDEINDKSVALDTLRTKYQGIVQLIPDMGTYINNLNAHKESVGNAITACQQKIDNGTNSYTWDEISAIIYPFVDTNKLTVGGKTINELKESVKNPDGSINMNEALALVQGGILIVVPTGSGILSDISDFAGDYTAKVSATITYNGSPMSGEATMTTKTEKNPVYLTACYNGLRNGTVANSSNSNAITDYFGYAIDLAFRTNAAESNLLLQTDPQNRIWENEDTAILQGGGSYMSFTTSAGLSATKMVRLMQGIRVVFMDKEQTVLGIAALDCTLGQDVYTVLSESEQTSTGKHAYLDIGTAYQKSDLITQAEYEALPEKSSVTIENGKITAKLYLYDFEMTKSSTSTEEDTRYTGGITLDKTAKKNNDAVITALEQDEAKIVTALVYLDGSVVNNSSVAANASYSMTGTLNLQFASSAQLMPANNNALRGDKSVVYTELEDITYKAGYYYDSGTLYKRNEGVKLYTGSDGKMYYSTDSENYLELTATSEVLTAVTATLSGEATAKAGTAFELTAALNDSLTVKEYKLTRADGTAVDATADSAGKFTVIETSEGEYKYQAVLTVLVGTGDNNAQKQEYTITTKEVTVNVTAAN